MHLTSYLCIFPKLISNFSEYVSYLSSFEEMNLHINEQNASKDVAFFSQGSTLKQCAIINWECYTEASHKPNVFKEIEALPLKMAASPCHIYVN